MSDKQIRGIFGPLLKKLNPTGKTRAMRPNQSYDIGVIKQAFWEIFHESGELWFNYLGTDEENKETTAYYWGEFLGCLEKLRMEVTDERE